MFSDISNGDVIFYAGIFIMLFAVILAIIFLIVFIYGGKKLNIQLEREYGKPWDYNH